MRTVRLALLACLALASAFAQAPQNYTYEYPSLLNPYSSSQWTSNGANSPSTGMYTSSASTGGSLIFCPTIAAPSNCYEVHFKLSLASPSGTYIAYLRATQLFNFPSAKAAQTFFDTVQFQFVFLGVMLIKPGDGPGGWVQADVIPAPAQSIPATPENPVNVVQINMNYNWLFFNLNPAHNVVTGANTVVNYLAYVNWLGGISLSNLQLATLIILHELGHLLYPSMDSMIDSSQFGKLIITDCIQ
jgi:hypothetical protein